jgi:hypothetical protein
LYPYLYVVAIPISYTTHHLSSIAYRWVLLALPRDGIFPYAIDVIYNI